MKEYTKTHEWFEKADGIATVGITYAALEEIGEIVYVELPKIGKEVKEGDDATVLESTKAAVDISSPVSGQIIAINDSLKTNIVPLNKDPENSGWLFKVKLPIS